MTVADGGPKRSAEKYLTGLDDWTDQLRLLSLVAEALDVISESDVKTALELIGGRYGTIGWSGRDKLLKRWPAVQVVITAYVAAERYDSGIWPQLKQLLGGERLGQGFNEEWGSAFLRNLETLGMPTFREQGEEAGQRFAGRMILHSGIPTFCLPDLFKLLLDWRGRDPNLSPALFVGRAADRYSVGKLFNVDKPVGRFLRFGGEFAVDVVDRCFDLLDIVATDGDLATVPLPDRFKRVAQDLRKSGVTVPAPRVRAGASNVEQGVRPRLVVEPFGRGVMLRLPPVGESPDGRATWHVTLDDETRTIQSAALLPGSGDPAPQTDVPIPTPIRLATAALDRRPDLTFPIQVVDDRRPVLAFDDDGVALGVGSGLPGRPLWLLFAGEPASLTVSGEGPILSESLLPPGWTGWSLLYLDLTKASQVTIAGSDVQLLVRGEANARIVTGDPIVGARSGRGNPIFTAIPEIQLPASLSDANWSVDLLDTNGAAIASWRRGADSSDPNDVWNDVPKPVFGGFTVRVRGPWGRGAMRTLTISEGLTVRFSPEWRRFVTGGLYLCDAEISAAAGLEISEPTLRFDTGQREASLQLSAHNWTQTLIVTPPHMAVAYQSADNVTDYSIRPLDLFREDLLDEAGMLLLSFQSSAEPTLHVLTQKGSIQQVTPAAGRTGVYRFDLRRITDTLQAQPQARLSLDPEGELTVATIMPRELLSGVIPSGAGLSFLDAVDVEGLTAYVYATRAPWRPPVELPIVDGWAALPADLVEAGPLRLLVRIEDPWVPLPVPNWPFGESLIVQAPGHVVDVDDEATELSVYLAGTGEFPSTVTDYGRLWRVRGSLASISLGDRIRHVGETLDRVLAQEPRPSILALMTAQVPSEQIPELIIRTGLAYADVHSAHDDEPPTWTLATALPAALLSWADEKWSPDEIDAAVTVCGELVSEILSGHDPDATQGRFDQGAQIFDAMPEQRDAILRGLRLVPTGLLSGSARTGASIKLLENRRDQRLTAILRSSGKVLKEASVIIGQIGSPAAQAAFRARLSPTADLGWQTLPAISVGLALIARYVARGDKSRQWLTGVSNLWADLARIAPELVTIDLILADLTVAGESMTQPEPVVDEEEEV